MAAKKKFIVFKLATFELEKETKKRYYFYNSSNNLEICKKGTQDAMIIEAESLEEADAEILRMAELEKPRYFKEYLAILIEFFEATYPHICAYVLNRSFNNTICDFYKKELYSNELINASDEYGKKISDLKNKNTIIRGRAANCSFSEMNEYLGSGIDNFFLSKGFLKIMVNADDNEDIYRPIYLNLKNERLKFLDLNNELIGYIDDESDNYKNRLLFHIICDTNKRYFHGNFWGIDDFDLEFHVSPKDFKNILNSINKNSIKSLRDTLKSLQYVSLVLTNSGEPYISLKFSEGLSRAETVALNLKKNGLCYDMPFYTYSKNKKFFSEILTKENYTKVEIGKDAFFYIHNNLILSMKISSANLIYFRDGEERFFTQNDTEYNRSYIIECIKKAIKKSSQPELVSVWELQQELGE